MSDREAEVRHLCVTRLGTESSNMDPSCTAAVSVAILQLQVDVGRKCGWTQGVGTQGERPTNVEKARWLVMRN